MSLFDYISERLFPSGKKVNIHETLRRSPKFLDDYKRWFGEPPFQNLMKELFNAWVQQNKDIGSRIDMQIYRSKQAEGFVVHPEFEDGMIPLSFLMEYLKERLLQESYRLVHADRIIEGRPDHLEIRENYHFKPGPSFIEPFEQKFGNVHIELLRYDKQEIRLKFLVTVYSDRKYKKPWEFENLVCLLFDI